MDNAVQTETMIRTKDSPGIPRRRSTWLGLLGCAAIVAATSPWAAASSVVSANFDSGVPTGWTASNGAAATGSESAFTQHTNGKSVDLNDSSTASNPALTTPAFNSTATSTNGIEINFDFQMLHPNSGQSATILVEDSSYHKAILFGFFDHSGRLSYKTQSGWVSDSKYNPSTNTWYHVNITATPTGSNATWSYQITDTSNNVLSSGSNIAMATTPSDYATATFVDNSPTNTQGSEWQIDNVQITPVPEPASLPASLVLGATALLGGRVSRSLRRV